MSAYLLQALVAASLIGQGINDLAHESWNVRGGGNEEEEGMINSEWWRKGQQLDGDSSCCRGFSSFFIHLNA